MSLQSDDLSMTGLGVPGAQPAAPYQAQLATGNHLRWGFRRDLGFPWHGFHLFRRPSRPGSAFCLSAVTGGLKAGGTPGGKHYTALGVLSSDAGLVLTDDFAPAGRVEFALGGRKYLRFELPEGEPARRVVLSLGFRRACLEVAQLIPPPRAVTPGESLFLASPLTAQGVTARVLSPTGGAQFDVVDTDTGPLTGLSCAQARVVVTLPAACNEVELLLTRRDASPALEAFDAGGRPVAKAQMQGAFNRPEAVRLKGEGIVSVRITPASKGAAYLHRVCADGPGGGKSEIKVTAYSGPTPARVVTVVGQAGKVVSAALEADHITAVELGGGGPAALVDLCYVPVAQDATKGWERLSDFPYPLGLPVTQPDYPCSAAAPQTLLAQRVRHPWPPGWDASAFTELHDQLKELVRGGPPAEPMADRLFAAPPAQASQQDADPPRLSKFYLLDMVLLGALHPALAQAVGLYWVDRTAERGTAYDYLIVADHTGAGRRDPARVLEVIGSSGFADLDGYIRFNLRLAAEPPLAPPAGLEAYELPGGTFPDAQGQLPQWVNNVGLRWDIGRDGAGALLPGSAVMYLVWRAYLGDGAAPAAATASAYGLATRLPPDEPRPVMVAETRLPNGVAPQRPPDWPQVSLHFIDRNLKDGWYGFRVSGIDLFGRHSAQGPPVQLLVYDKLPPAPPTGVEAYALDPEDPHLQRDAAYNAWRAALDPSVRQTLVGLRVRWRWTAAHRRHSPDTREFRVYFHPGAALPADPDEAADWQERYFVVDYGSSFVNDPQNGDRVYEIFLPPAGSANPASVPLNPTPAEPVVYAHVGVSAADDRPRGQDTRTGGAWGGRQGNEGSVGPPAKIYRVLRTPPPAPEDLMGGARLRASNADYRGDSRFTYRWKPQPHLKLHVYRALDDAVFQADWAGRAAAPQLDASRLELFPAAWNAATRQGVADELNHLNAFAGPNVAGGEAQAFAYYRGLSDAALRVLAGLPSSEGAFVQLTKTPLDADDPANADRPGPDTPDGYAPDPARRAFIDTLDGRAFNRYFYRSAYVDGAHNVGPLGLSSPPVYLPKVLPPRAPSVTGALGGDRRVTLKWASNRDPDLAEYRVYRAGREGDTRDLRLMKLAHTEPAPPGDPATRPAEVTWDDAPLPGMKTFYYRLVAVDASGNVSPPSAVVSARAFDDARPDPPTWNPPAAGATPVAVVLSWASALPDLRCMVQRRGAAGGDWENLSGWLARGLYSYEDAGRVAGASYVYRLRVLDAGGRGNRAFDELTI